MLKLHLCKRWPVDAKKNWLIWKDYDDGKDWRQEEKGMTEDEVVGWHHWAQWTWVWVNSESWWWTGRPGVLRFMGSQRVRHGWATELNWTEHLCFTNNVQFSSVAQLCLTQWPHGLQHTRLPCPYQFPELAQTHVHKVGDAIQRFHPLFTPFSSCLHSFPASGSFPMSQFFISGGQSIGASASASVLPMIQDCFPLGLTGLISLLSKELSRVISNTTVQKHQFFNAKLSL